MVKRFSSSVRLAFAIFLVLLLVFNLQMIVPTAEGTEEVEEEIDGSRILTDDEVMDLGLTAPPTRGEPWNVWERYSYHPGGENGATVMYGDRIYIFMGGSPGYQGGYNGYQDVFYYNITSFEWVAVEKSFKPGARGYFGDAYDSVNERLIIYGGYESGSMMDDLWEFDLKTETWSRLLSSGVLEPSFKRRARAPAVVDTTDNTFYIHMGRADNIEPVDNLTGFYKIDLTTPSAGAVGLSDGTNMGLIPRYEHDMCIDESGRKIYMYGGYNEDQRYLEEFWIYDMTGNQWLQIPTHPDMQRLYGARMFYRPSDGTVNIWGGLISGTTESDVMWTYDTSLGTWENTTYLDAPSGRLLYFNHYSTEDDKFVVFAGRYYSGNRNYRYRDVNYLDIGTGTWTSFPNKDSSSSETNGIFAFDDDRQRIYYAAQFAGYSNGTEYISYWDIAQKDWIGPFYNPGAEGPRSVSNAGWCFDKANMTVYMYGGGWTEGTQQNRRYYDYNGFWKLDLNTYTWTLLMDEAGPQKRQGFEMIFNTVDGQIYIYGGYHHPTTASATEIRDDFYKFDPNLKIFQPLTRTGENPGGRRGSALCFIEEKNQIYLMGGIENTVPTPTDERDLWRYDVDTNRWTELTRTTSSRTYGKLDYDPLTKELYLTGGANDDFVKYRILEDKWYSDWYPDPNPGTLNGHAHYFDPVNRDMWVFGGGARSGVWRIGIPPRLAIQTAYFDDPDGGEDIAYSMYRPYKFGTTVKMVNDENDLSRIKIEFPHRNGAFRLVYNHTIAETGGNGWTESDPLDVAELVGSPTVSWDGLVVTIEFQVMFHWNWSNKPNSIDRQIKVNAYGINVAPDLLVVREFLRVTSTLKFRGSLDLYGGIQGDLEDSDWVQTDEPITVSGPIITYTGTTSFFPPVETYSLDLWIGSEKTDTVNVAAGEMINYTYRASNVSNLDVQYTLNISGVNDATADGSILVWNISIDGVAPESPNNIQIHDSSPDDIPVLSDNDLDIVLTWQAGREDMSGIMNYYWDYEDNGGTENGFPMNRTQMDITLPSTGYHTIFIWAVDEVGNIGPSSNATILVDMEGIDFIIVSPDLNGTIPYQTIDIKFNVSDNGGSKIISQSIQYRFTNDGQGDDHWIGGDAWKYMPDLWTAFQQEYYEFTIPIGKDGIQKLSDSDENFLQLKARDGAGSLFESPIYNINVDTSLRYPVSTLTAPDDGTVYEGKDKENVKLEWEVDFFAPEDVLYNLYISKVKVQVELWDDTIKIPVFDMDHTPDFLEFGKYYWTIIPVARGQWVGSCDNGIWSFTVEVGVEDGFEVTTNDRTHKYQQGQAGIPITFEITNFASENVWIEPTSNLANIATIDWQNLDTEERKYKLLPDETKEVNGLLFIKTGATIGNHEIYFYFENQYQINRTVMINVEVIGVVDDDDDDEDPIIDVGMVIAFIFVGIIVLMMIIAALYFLVLKKKKGPGATEEQLARMEQQMMDEGHSVTELLASAPVPKGLGKAITKGTPQEGEDIPEMDEWDEADVEEEIKLVEDGAEDDWMNLVAAETVAAESKPEIVEEKKVDSDQNKSLSDLLSEMSGDIEEEEP